MLSLAAFTAVFGEPRVIAQGAAATRGAPAIPLLKLIGTYALGPSVIASITANGDRLYLQVSDDGPVVGLDRIAGDRFKLSGAGGEVSFESDSGGQVSALVLHLSGGRNYRAAKSAFDFGPAGPKRSR